MPTHDPKCPNYLTSNYVGWPCGYCTLIRDVRKDERNRLADIIAQEEKRYSRILAEAYDAYFEGKRDAYDDAEELIRRK